MVELTKAACLCLFLHMSKGIWQPCPISFSASWPNKADIPILAPVLNWNAYPLPHCDAVQCCLPSSWTFWKALHQSHPMTCLSFLIPDVHVPVLLTRMIALASSVLSRMSSYKEFLGLQVQQGIGQVKWTLLNEFNQHIDVILTWCLYVPDATMCLLPLQQLSMGNNTSNANGLWIAFSKQAFVFYEGHCIAFPYHDDSNLSMAKLAPGISRFHTF